MNKVDPITFAVIRNKLISIANGMQETGFRTGVTTFMYEIMDCSFAILDSSGGVIAQSSVGILLFLGSLGPAVKNCLDIIDKENIEEGDVIVSTVPDITGSHASDAVVFMPIFFNGNLFGYAATKAHWIDVGAKDTYPTDAKNIFEEGLRIPPIKLYRKGELQKDVWDIIKWNSRAPELVWGDMQAQIAGCHFAETQVVQLLTKYGMETVETIISEMYDYSERVTRVAIEKIPDGSWTAEDFMDNNGIDLDKPVNLKVTVTVKGSDITIDLTGSDPEQEGPDNGLWVTTLSAARSAVKALTSPKLPSNEGFNRPVHVIAPQGCVYNANPGVPSYLCGNVAQTILELVNKAMYKVLPERIPACSGGDVVGNGFFGKYRETGDYWGTITPSIIGQGADTYSDGDGYVIYTAAGTSKNIPTEILESTFPLFVEKVEFIRDSGGAGRQRGGVGSRICIRLLEPAFFYSFIEKGKSPHWGFDGGLNGLRNFALVKSKKKGEFEVLKSSGIPLDKGDEVIVTAGGGGGYGNPFDREIEKVRMDVINGYVSAECARAYYGVQIDPQTFKVDLEATGKLREKISTRP
ncbi:MAG: hydantoinase B/oxoprolinase family protein [Deltaproteobacteria bacterium]|nr:hydantoinase B/oxoprolinase family protein [Deltaproteobacteria bacterium]